MQEASKRMPEKRVSMYRLVIIDSTRHCDITYAANLIKELTKFILFSRDELFK